MSGPPGRSLRPLRLGLLVVVLIVACRTESPSSVTSDPSSERASTSATDSLPDGINAELYKRGQVIFEKTCNRCHPQNLIEYVMERHHTDRFPGSCQSCHPQSPPPLKAPHVQGIAGFYRESFHDSSAAIDAMAQFMAEPDSGTARLDSADLEQWGVMPPLELSESERRAVAYWLWKQYEPN